MDWTTSRFRSSAALALRRLEELSPEQRAPFEELQQDEDFYGLLVPRESGTVKSVGRHAAELFLRLASPAPIDANALGDDEYRADVIDLVLDGVLEIESGERFVFGADAFPLFFPDAPPPADGGRIAELSREALRHAEDVDTTDPGALTAALYTYNRIPRTRAWVARFPDRDAVLAHIGARDASLHSLLDRHWTMGPPNGWISWHSHVRPATGSEAITWKLYVSPRPEQIRDAFHALVRVLAAIPGAQMKIGPDASGLLRPDKLLAYFATREDLDAAASALARALQGCPAHGVPFTAGVDPDGLLSWGADPPDSERALSWLERESWRLWIAKSLGSAMSIAKRAGSPPVAPWRFALERVRRYGVDVDTWTPADTLWRPAA